MQERTASANAVSLSKGKDRVYKKPNADHFTRKRQQLIQASLVQDWLVYKETGW